MLFLCNVTTRTETFVPNNHVTPFELSKIDAVPGDRIAIVDVVAELIEQGCRQVPGTNRYESRLVRREVSRKTVQSGTVRKGNIIQCCAAWA